MRFWFDVDGTLCEHRTDGRYDLAEPDPERIAEVNRLHADGHFIGIHTARGQMTGEDWEQKTREQLGRWGVKYHEFRFKPYADVYVDDKGARPEEFFG